MKCLLLGDVGRRNLYHLGDEAMTKIAINMLHDRGVSEITLVATHPDAATELYGLPSVRRIGFEAGWGRNRSEEVLQAVTAHPPEKGGVGFELWSAAAEADIVVIAGGGNMNTQFSHHLYERVALTRIAQATNTPLVVTSQTVGPMLHQRDRALLSECLAYASLFGLRDDDSLVIGEEIAGGRPFFRTADDGVLVTPSGGASEVRRIEKVPDEYFIASFTADQGSSGFSAAEYERLIVETLDQLATSLGLYAVLLPHTGTLSAGSAIGDHAMNERLVTASTSGKLISLRPLETQEAVDVIAGSRFSLSTRYHAAVFATALGIPAAAIAMSHYSTVRLTGALSAFGLAAYVLPASGWELVLPAVYELLQWQSKNPEALRNISARRKSEQEQWWDMSVGNHSVCTQSLRHSFEAVAQLEPEGSWYAQSRVESRIFHIEATARAEKEQAEKTLRVTEQQLVEVQNQLLAMRERAERAESRKIVRTVDAVARRLRKRF